MHFARALNVVAKRRENVARRELGRLITFMADPSQLSNPPTERDNVPSSRRRLINMASLTGGYPN